MGEYRPRSTTPAFSQPRTCSLAGNVPIRSRRKLWSIRWRSGFQIGVENRRRCRRRAGPRSRVPCSTSIHGVVRGDVAECPRRIGHVNWTLHSSRGHNAALRPAQRVGNLRRRRHRLQEARGSRADPVLGADPKCEYARCVVTAGPWPLARPGCHTATGSRINPPAREDQRWIRAHAYWVNRPGFARGWGSGHLAPLGDGVSIHDFTFNGSQVVDR